MSNGCSAVGCRYVVDLDDAIFHTYDQHPYPFVRRFLGRKVDAVLKNATAVVAGNDYLADRARQAGAASVVVVPTCVDDRAYAAAPRPARGDRPTFCWIGSPATEYYLNTIAPELEDLCRGIPASLRLIGAAPDGTSFPAAIRRPWSEQTEIAELLACDIGLAPLLGAPWDRGKCGLKAIQYMAAGLPVLAARIGALPEIVVHGETGFVYADGNGILGLWPPSSPAAPSFAPRWAKPAGNGWRSTTPCSAGPRYSAKLCPDAARQ